MNGENEIWKDIDVLEGSYQISNLGNIKSVERLYVGKDGLTYRYKEKILKQGINRHGYSIISVRKNGVKITLKIHRLVGIAFVPNPENKPEINHKFGDKRDNRAVSLEWNTRSENCSHAYKTSLRSAIGENNYRAVLTENDVKFILQNKNIPNRVLSYKYKVHHKTIARIRNNKLWKHIDRTQLTF